MAYMEGTGHIWRWQDLQNKETNLRTEIIRTQLDKIIKKEKLIQTCTYLFYMYLKYFF